MELIVELFGWILATCAVAFGVGLIFICAIPFLFVIFSTMLYFSVEALGSFLQVIL